MQIWTFPFIRLHFAYLCEVEVGVSCRRWILADCWYLVICTYQ
jgi:hypothetical protein